MQESSRERERERDCAREIEMRESKRKMREIERAIVRVRGIVRNCKRSIVTERLQERGRVIVCVRDLRESGEGIVCVREGLCESARDWGGERERAIVRERLSVREILWE